MFYKYTVIGDSAAHFLQITVELQLDQAFSYFGTSITANEAIRETVDSIKGGTERVDANGGNYIKTYLQQLLKVCFLFRVGGIRTTEELMKAIAELEGWYPVDGSIGINLVDVEQIAFDENDFAVVDVTYETPILI